ncbi:MAG: excinuclease ABC subunit UvrA [Eubacteriales bacterium]|uniref:excinuclease ABC subunit UvrA n=1 Tax=Fenollaria sp. TaxID=1965292 RepID=UPI002A75C21D|nr:excinuclease ABC subunit UvrA [Fenollaria sp.]MDD7339253.1 excinuclease ABC subunit UvrA [Eubacteriales bacterium]MDY3106249.1 excinuclease ABC subunit UvrA [Fenollaria sp.]
MENKIVIRGANENNLKNLDIDIPRNKFVVITGLSGSGKSSLAFDTIYAEGQRRYVESLSSYARMFLGNTTKPNVEFISGLSPSISIDQKTTSNNPRSTVGTVTEVYDYLRLLYARIGQIYCPSCGKKITSQTIDQIADIIMSYDEGQKIYVLAPIVRGQKGQHKKVLEQIQKDGFVRYILDGEMHDITDKVDIDKNKKHDIDIVIDRLVIKDGILSRLTGSLETAVHYSNGLVKINYLDLYEKSYSTKYACIDCGISFDELSTRLFSFNSPFGMCERCNGLGYFRSIDKDLVIPDYSLSLEEGVIEPFKNSKKGTYYYKIFKFILDKYDFKEDQPFSEAPKKMIDDLLNGTDYNVRFKYNSLFTKTSKEFNKKWPGILSVMMDRLTSSMSQAVRDNTEEYVEEIECPECHGARLKKEALAVRVGDLNIYEFTQLSIKDELDYINNLKLNETEEKISEQILIEIKKRLSFLITVGLDYLNLSRMAKTLSGGEAQRIRLATQIGSALVGVIYVLDEPSIGLHQRDNLKLIQALRELTDAGNTLLVVEHDEEIMHHCDEIIDIGPGAGIHGGHLVVQGNINKVMKCKKSITGDYLSGRKKIPLKDDYRKTDKDNVLRVIGASENNLKNIDVEVPLSEFVTVTGVSGSGKSTLVNEIIYKSLAQKINKSKYKPGKRKAVEGIENIDKVVVIDQSPIGRTPRSNPATYTGTFDLIRDVFAMTQEAKMRGYQKGRFSFNVKGGRCEACKGDGILKVEMHFLPDVYVPCEVCKGKRYNRETLEVKFKDKTIADVLDMTVEEGLKFFENQPRIARKLQTLYDVGLGYIKIGQSSTELSGGEAQRVKLATELSKKSTGRTIYILDEPTTGLHSHDVAKLIKVLNTLVDQNNSVLVIEHNLDVIKQSDYIIDLGPEGGDMGGTIVATGTPIEVAKNKKSYTGKFLREIFEKEGKL